MNSVRVKGLQNRKNPSHVIINSTCIMYHPMVGELPNKSSRNKKQADASV